MDPWLARLRHDVVKRAVWAARDLRDSGEAPTAADFASLRGGVLALADGAGRPATALEVWRALRPAAPARLEASALDAFERALACAQAAAVALEKGDERALPNALAAVLELEPAFEDLRRALG